jgi:hypothetical protein
MKSILLHQRAIELLELYERCYREMLDIQDHIVHYGYKYVEVLPKSSLEHKFQIKQNSLKRIEKRYMDVVNYLQTQCIQRTF